MEERRIDNKHRLELIKELQQACKDGHLDVVNSIILKGGSNLEFGVESEYPEYPEDPVWNYGLWGACQSGHMAIVELMISKGATNLNCGLEKACQSGHMAIVELMISKGANGWNSGLQMACLHGHIDIVELMISKGASYTSPEHNCGCEYGYCWSCLDAMDLYRDCVIDLNNALRNACKSGHLTIVKLLLEKGAQSWPYGLWDSCEHGHIDVVELMLLKNASSPELTLDRGLSIACESGRMDIIQLMMSKIDNKDWNLALEGACLGGHLDIVEFVISMAGSEGLDWNRGLQKACKGGHIDIVRLMLLKGAKDFKTDFLSRNNGLPDDILIQLIEKCDTSDLNTNFFYVCAYNKKNIIDLIISKGANDWERGFSGACAHKRGDIMYLMISHGAKVRKHAKDSYTKYTNEIKNTVELIGLDDCNSIVYKFLAL